MCKLREFYSSVLIARTYTFPLLIVMFTGNFVFLGLLLGIYKNLSPNLPETIITLVVAISMRILGDRYWGRQISICMPLEYYHFPRYIQIMMGFITKAQLSLLSLLSLLSHCIFSNSSGQGHMVGLLNLFVRYPNIRLLPLCGRKNLRKSSTNRPTRHLYALVKRGVAK